MSNVRQLDESGTNEADIMEKASTLYRNKYGNKTKKFPFMHCWEAIQDLPIFFEPTKSEVGKTLGKRAPSTRNVSTMVPLNLTSSSNPIAGPTVGGPNSQGPSASTPN